MPLACDPQQTFGVVLKSDADKPEGERPTFTFRYLSGREWVKVSEVFDGIQKSSSGPEALKTIFEQLATGLVGWKNMPDPATGKPMAFDKQNIDVLVNPAEACELLGAIIERTTPGAGDLGNSGSPQASAAAPSVKPVRKPARKRRTKLSR